MALRFQKPVAKEVPPAFREGDVCEEPVVRAKHPAYGWGWYAHDPGPGDANWDRPVRWVEEEPDDPDHSGGWWAFTKDCD